jgi:GntR family transcriptional regulator
LWFDLDPRSSTPLYQQLVQGVKEAVARGILQPGERMPTVRELAAELAINPNTIAKAYQRLEQEGIIATMRSRGSFVAGGPSRLDNEEGRQRLVDMLDKLLVEAYHLGLTSDELQVLFQERLQQWPEKRGGE